MEAYVADGRDFAVETTLSGRAYAARIRRWQARGYRVAIIYLRLASADLAVKRVARRVREGGHDIPKSVVRRRFFRSWVNFVELYRELADEWRVYDNPVTGPVLMAESDDWRGVREPRPTWRPRDDRDEQPSRETPRREPAHKLSGRNLMSEHPRRFPEGEPSNESVLAALSRARDRALARAAAVRRGETPEEPAGKTERADPRARRDAVGSAKGGG